MRWGLIAIMSVFSASSAAGKFSGIHELAVLVENLPAVATNAGVQKRALKKEVEDKLKSSGVSVSGPKAPYLYLNVRALKTITSGYAFKCTLALKEKAIIPRQPKKWQIVATWERDVLGLSPGDDLAKSVKECAATLTSYFVREYRQFSRGISSN